MAEMSQTEMQINLSALKKHDSDIDRIIDTASSVAHYKFRASSGVWDKTDVEGSLFLYLRNVSPCIALFTMNRLNKENTKLNLAPDMDFKVQKPFLLCKAANSEIIGIWFYDELECQRFGTLLSKLSLLAKDERALRVASITQADKNYPQPVTQKNDLLDMFSKANEEFKKSHSKQVESKTPKPSKTKGKQQKVPTVLKRNPDAIFPQKSTEDNARDERTPPRYHDDDHSQRVASQKHSRSRTMSSSEEKEGREDFTSPAGDLAILDRLGIIREQPKHKVIGCAELESTILNTARVAKSKSASSIQLLSPSILASKTAKDLKASSSGSNLLNGQQKVSLAVNFPANSSRIQKKLFSDEKAEEKVREAPSAASLNFLMSPAAFQLSNKPKKDTLNKEDFQAAFIHVLQTDDRFVSALHEAYVSNNRKGS